MAAASAASTSVRGTVQAVRLDSAIIEVGGAPQPYVPAEVFSLRPRPRRKQARPRGSPARRSPDRNRSRRVPVGPGRVKKLGDGVATNTELTCLADAKRRKLAVLDAPVDGQRAEA